MGLINISRKSVNNVFNGQIKRFVSSPIKSLKSLFGGEAPKLKTLEADVVSISRDLSPNLQLSPQKFIKQSKYLRKYEEITNIWRKRHLGNDDANIKNALENLDTKQLSDVENVIKEIIEKTKVFNKKSISLRPDIFKTVTEEINRLKNLVDLYVKDKSAYQYVMNSDVLFGRFFYNHTTGYLGTASCLDNLTVGTLKSIENILTKIDKSISYFVHDSSRIYSNDKKAKLLSNLISTKKTNSILTALRAEKHVGMFNGIVVDKELTSLIKFNNETMKMKTCDVKIYEYSMTYYGDSVKNQSLYEYIKNAEVLTLSDAMEFAKFSDNKTLNMIFDAIKNAKVQDSRFKSLTLSKDFVESWIGRQYDYSSCASAKIIQKIRVMPNTEAIYIDDLNYPNGQFEIILNKKKKQISVQKVEFDKKRNVFYLESQIEQI